jgi:hypothetical protein
MNLLGTQFEPTSRIREQLPLVSVNGGEVMLSVPAITGNPGDGTSGGLATQLDQSPSSSPGTVGQPTDMNSLTKFPATSPGGNPNPASTNFSVGGTLTNLVNTVIADVTGFVPWIIIAVILWFVYKYFFKHGR